MSKFLPLLLLSLLSLVSLGLYHFDMVESVMDFMRTSKIDIGIQIISITLLVYWTLLELKNTFMAREHPDNV